MSQLLHLLQGSVFAYRLNLQKHTGNSLVLLRQKPCLYYRKNTSFKIYQSVQFSDQAGCWEVVDDAETCSLPHKEKHCDEAEPDAIPHIQTLRKFPREELCGKVVMVRFDSAILLQDKLDHQSLSVINAISTIKYLCESGSKVILVSNWSVQINSKLLSVDYVAGFLSSVLQLKVVPVKFDPRHMQSVMEDGAKSYILLLENLSQFKGEVANCSNFAKQLSSGVDIFVNDAFSRSHKILASTVGITCFCYASVAGFHFEEGLNQLKRAINTNKKPFVVVIGGGSLSSKAPALHSLASRCDGLVFVGHMAFQIMHALGLPASAKLVEHGALKDALNIVQLAKLRAIPILFPKDFWFVNDHHPKQLAIHPTQCISDGWQPIDLGPSSLDEMTSLLSKCWQPIDLGPSSLDEMTSLLSKCEKILWIGPVKFSLSRDNVGEASTLALMLDKLSQSTCEIIVVGNVACQALRRKSLVPTFSMLENASVLWEFLKGRTIPALMALDRAFPFSIDWHSTYTDPAEPLVVDIGSGNGTFLFRMARRRRDLNFLGLEINEKLVNRCLDFVHQSGMKNGYFIATNATTTFRSIVSRYPGELVLVSIQCPNPDFNKPEHRWRMLQRSLVEAVVDLLTVDGKVFLQSDIERVAVRMKEQFVKHGKGLLDQEHANESGGGWLKENPFGVRSDWEQHVMDKRAPMYRMMFSKLASKKH